MFASWNKGATPFSEAVEWLDDFILDKFPDLYLDEINFDYERILP